ncbi:two component transcriptional regulator winged helix family [Clostridium sp. CAG:492]|nr:two component transcriptional regulator winged helix family [Clostridium sp. CAG:492]
MKNILLIEDNESILKGLVYSLEQERFKVTTAMTIKDSKNLLESNNIYNLIILDISLPDGSGFDLCKYIKSNYNIPIIFLTAKDEEQDVVQGFDLGADDYIIKPFRIRELISRANNILRRYNNIQTNIITSSNIKIDLDAQRVYKNDDEIVLTALEYKILALLFTNINQTVSREKILDKIWDIAGNYVNDNTLTVYIKRIRAKLSPNDIIKTIKGIGYRIEN